jgi:type I restriction enzyme, S subunit
MGVGSVMRHFGPTHLASMSVSLPPVPVQAAIAGALEALDNKIAINNRITVASDHLAASVFDQILTDDDQRTLVSLSEIALVNQRKVVPVPGGLLRYIEISSVTPGSVAWPSRIPWSAAPGRARRGVAPGDTIWSTVRPERRSYAFILANDPELVVSTGFAVLTPLKVGPAFLYEITKRDDFVRYLESVAEGSAYPAVRADRFNKAAVPLLSPARLREFEEFAMPLRRRANAAQMESRELAELRDILLPSLMSGAIRVREAERIVEDAT